MKNIIFIFIAILLFANCNLHSQEFYKLSISELCELAISQSPEVNRLQEQSDALRSQAKASYSPQSPFLTYTLEGIDFPQRGLYNEARWQITQSIQSPVTSYYNYKSNDLSAEANKKLKTANQFIAKYQIKNAAFMLSRSKMMFDAIENRNALYDSLLKITKFRFEQGDINQTDYDRIALVVFNSMNEISRIKSNLRANELEIMRLAGIPSSRNTILELDFAFDYKQYELNNLSVPPFQENNRLAAFQDFITSQDYVRKSTMSELTPDINLSYYRQAFNSSFDYYGFDISLSLPIWFGVGTARRLEVAESQIEIARWNMIDLERQLRQDYLDAVNQMKFSAEIVENYLINIIPANEKLLSYSLIAYKTGELDLTDILQTQINITESELNYADELYKYYNSISIIEMIAEINIIN